VEAAPHAPLRRGASPTCFIELDAAAFIELAAAAWTDNTVRETARNTSPSASIDLGPATLSVQVTKRRIP
jgi:hypothetical protein